MISASCRANCPIHDLFARSLQSTGIWAGCSLPGDAHHRWTHACSLTVYVWSVGIRPTRNFLLRWANGWESEIPSTCCNTNELQCNVNVPRTLYELHQLNLYCGVVNVLVADVHVDMCCKTCYNTMLLYTNRIQYNFDVPRPSIPHSCYFLVFICVIYLLISSLSFYFRFPFQFCFYIFVSTYLMINDWLIVGESASWSRVATGRDT